MSFHFSTMITTPKKRGRKRKQIIIDNSEPREKRRNIRIIKAVKMNIGGIDYYVSGENHPVHILVYDVTTHLCVGRYCENGTMHHYPIPPDPDYDLCFRLVDSLVSDS